MRFPWLYLDATQSVILTTETQVLWLTQLLLLNLEQADAEHILHLQQRYEIEAQNLNALVYPVKKCG